VIGTQTLFKI